MNYEVCYMRNFKTPSVSPREPKSPVLRLKVDRLGRSIAAPTEMSQCRRAAPDITNFLLYTTFTRAVLRLCTRLQNQPHLNEDMSWLLGRRRIWYLCFKEVVGTNQRPVIQHLSSDIMPKRRIQRIICPPFALWIINGPGVVFELPHRCAPRMRIRNVCKVCLMAENTKSFGIDLVDTPACIVVCDGDNGGANKGYVERRSVVDHCCVTEARCGV